MKIPELISAEAAVAKSQTEIETLVKLRDKALAQAAEYTKMINEITAPANNAYKEAVKLQERTLGPWRNDGSSSFSRRRLSLKGQEITEWWGIAAWFRLMAHYKEGFTNYEKVEWKWTLDIRGRGGITGIIIQGKTHEERLQEADQALMDYNYRLLDYLEEPTPNKEIP